MQPDEKVMIHAGASGVGAMTAIQRQSFGSPSFVTLGSEEKLQACLAMGADAGAVRHDGPFFEKAKAFAGDDGIDHPGSGWCRLPGRQRQAPGDRWTHF